MKTLIIVVPGMRCTTQEWNPLLERIAQESELGDVEIKRLDHHLSPWSIGSMDKICRNFEGDIISHLNLNPDYDQILLFGHSTGGLIVRYIYLIGLGSDNHWTQKVSRIVLFAGMSRGFVLDRNRQAKYGCMLLTPANIVLGWLARRHFIAFDLLAGSDFVATLRLKWMRNFSRTETPPPVVQILGQNDEVVEPRDSLDTEQFPNAWRIELSNANHGDVYRLPEGVAGEERYSRIREAVVGAVPESAKQTPVINKDVVFLLHGIHSHPDYWMNPVRDKIKVADPNLEIIHSTYGSFTALHFTMPGHRAKNLRWFLDEYSAALAKYPDAKFHFAGHSYGTYVFCRALAKQPELKFERVFLAGCVMPRKFQWKDLFSKEQVTSVRNVRATVDIPVSVLCNGLATIQHGDVGVAGFLGFDGAPDPIEQYLVKGGHSAALDSDEDYDHIVEYVVNGKDTFAKSLPSPPFFMRAASGAGAIFLPLLAIGLPILAAYYAFHGNFASAALCISPFLIFAIISTIIN